MTPTPRDDLRFTAEEALAMDAWLIGRGFTLEQLMGTAGRRVAEAARALLTERGLGRAVFLVGPGNNGGDAVVAEGLLRDEVETHLWRPLDGDATPALDASTLVVDGLFGVGLRRPVAGAARAAVEAVAASGAAVLAIDVPSGLSSDDGTVVGVTADDPDGGVAIRADRTVTFVGAKRGFDLGRGPELVGEWRAVDIGFPVEEAAAWVARRRMGKGDTPGGGRG